MEEETRKEKEMEARREEEAALIAFYSSFKDLFEFFCLNTTIHGSIRLVCSSQNKMKTAFWTLLFLASFAMLYWQFGLLFNQYWQYPVVVSISVKSQQRMFPAITLCNLNPYRIDLVSKNMAELDNLARETLHNLYPFSIKASDLEDNFSVSLENWTNNANSSSFKLDESIALLKMGSGKVGFRLCNQTGGDCYTKVYSSGVDAFQEWYRFHYMNIMSQIPPIIDISKDADHINNLVYSCQYDALPCKASETDYFHHPIYGSCYTFNKGGTDEFWKALKPGIVYGLSLILKVEQKDHIPLLSTKAGVRVMIHNHNQTAFLEHEGFDIRPGIQTTIGITQDEVTRLGGNYGTCTKDGDDVNVKLIYSNSTYTQQACLHSCFQRKMIDECGCGYYYYPLPPGTEYCNYNKHHNWGHCFYRLYNSVFNQAATHAKSCFDKCHRPCKETWYKLSAGYAKWPSDKSEGWIHKALEAQNKYNVTGNSFRKDIAKVNIYYERLNYKSWDESPEYTESQMMSNMGSNWSLWFGSSVLSVVELLEFLVDAAILSLIFLWRQFTAKRKLKVSQPPNISSISLTLEKYRYVEEGLASTQDVTKPYANDGTVTPCQDMKYGTYQVPELYPSVVLNGFRHRKEHFRDMGLKS